MARTYAVRLGGQQGPVAHTRGLYSSAAVTDGGVVGSSSVTGSDGLGVRESIALSSVNPEPARIAPVPQSTPWQHLWAALPGFVSTAQNNDTHVLQAVRSWKNPAGWYDVMWNLGQQAWPWDSSNGGKTFGERCLQFGGYDYPIGGYQNGSYTDQAMKDGLGNANPAINVYEIRLTEAYMAGDAATLGYTPTYPHRRLPHIFWPAHYYDGSGLGEYQATGGRLSQGINATQTTIRVQQTPTGNRPSGAESTWPYYASTAGASVYSGPVQSAVSWVYIDDPSDPEIGEIARVDGVSLDGSDVVLTVQRGYWGFTASARTAGTRVFCPVYIGGAEFMGAPGAYPRGLASFNDPARYAHRVDHPGYIEYRLKRYGDIYSFGIGSQTLIYDGQQTRLPTLWHQDISSSITYNINSWDGRLSGWPEKPDTWARDKGDVINTRDIQYNRQLDKFKGFRDGQTSVAGWPFVVWQGNSMSPFNTTDDDYNYSMERDFVDKVNIGQAGVPSDPPRKWDHATHEFWLSDIDDGHVWMHINNMILAANQTTPAHKALIWAKQARDGWGNDGQRYRRCTYATFCLAANPDETSVIYGGGGGNLSGTSPGGADVGQPNRLFRFNLGAGPRPTDIADLQQPYTAGRGYGSLTGSGGQHRYVFRRDLSNGVVVVNLTNSSYNFAVPDGRWWKVTETTDTEVTGTSVTIPAEDALFLTYSTEG